MLINAVVVVVGMNGEGKGKYKGRRGRVKRIRDDEEDKWKEE